MSFLPKAVLAQVDSICHAREERGVPPYEMYVGAIEMHTIPAGSVCFIPDLRLVEGASVPKYQRIKGEPLFIATDDVDLFVFLDPYGDFRIFNIREELTANFVIDEDNSEDDQFYVLVMHGLNFLFSDAEAPTLANQQQAIAALSQKLADKLAPPKPYLPFL